VRFSPDGNSLVSVGEDYVLKVMDSLTGKEVAMLKGHADTITCAAFSANGKTLASGSLDKTVKLWDVATGKERASLKGDPDGIGYVAFSLDGKTLTSVSGTMVHLWDVTTGKESAPLKQLPGVWPMAFSPDGKLLAFRDDTNLLNRDEANVCLWDVAKGQKLATLKHKRHINFLRFSSDGKTLAVVSGSRPGEIFLWDVASREVRATLKGHPADVYDVAFSSDGKTLASAGGEHGPTQPGAETETGYSGEIKLWDVKTGRELANLPDPDAWTVRSVAFSPDGKLLASVNEKGTIRLWATEGLLSAK
jgi:WD40 repeat protein